MDYFINFARYFSIRMKNYIKIFLAVSFVISLASCQGYEKLLKSNDFKKKYSEALRYYQEEDYLRASTLFDQCAAVFRGTKQADTVYFYQAMSYYHQRDYILAAHYFQGFSNTYGASPFIEDAEYMEAYCYYKQSPRPSLDQSPTRQAIQSFQLYLMKFPNSKRSDEARKYMDELRDKLVEKAFISARLYYDLEDYKAALVALNNCIIEYPDSKHREEITFMILKSSYLLAVNSILSKQAERYQSAIDEYYSFIAEYPESKYAREAKRYYRQASKSLGQEIRLENDELDEEENNTAS